MAAVMRHHAPMELGIYTFGEVTEDARHGGTISVEQRLDPAPPGHAIDRTDRRSG